MERSFLLFMAVSAIAVVGLATADSDDDGSVQLLPHQETKPEPCACVAVYAPICGTDGQTYSNAGCAKCSKVDVKCEGECPCTHPDPIQPTPGACICPALFAPVCGTDGKTYDNACLAECDGVATACDGPCPCKGPKPCTCTKEHAPVCGTDEKTYSNSCLAQCAGAIVECKGDCPCSGPCQCTEEYAPVCGVDGKTYSNKCYADCHRTQPKCRGECPCRDSCICTDEWAPVCGVDGAVYGNSCEAGCKGVEVQCQGNCPCDHRDPCKNCAACLAIDYINRPGELKCTKCDPGYVLNADGYCDGCVCTFHYDPVCGKDGKTYGNACSAGCEQVDIACSGECPCKKNKPGQCPEPKGFGICISECQHDSDCSGKQKCCSNGCGTTCQNPADPTCACTKEYNPVCGTDGTTYGNICTAQCAGAEVACKDECPCTHDKPGQCPAATGIGICIHQCDSDADCKGAQKCCSNGCGTVCQDPVNHPTGCPPDKPFAYCFVDPCQVASCPAFPHAKCVSDYCGGCHANFHVGRRDVTQFCESGSGGCPKETPKVECFVDPCQGSSCSAFPDAKCVADYCGACNANFFVGKRDVTKLCNAEGGECLPEGSRCQLRTAPGDSSNAKACCGQCCDCGAPVQFRQRKRKWGTCLNSCASCPRR